MIFGGPWPPVWDESYWTASLKYRVLMAGAISGKVIRGIDVYLLQ